VWANAITSTGTENERALLDRRTNYVHLHGDEVPKPETHQKENWKLQHKDEAKRNQEQCLTCHSQKGFCNRCHIVQVPHTEEFVTKHGPTAQEHLAACRNCHAEDFCQLCHTEMPAGAEAPK